MNDLGSVSKTTPPKSEQLKTALYLNSMRIVAVAQQLAVCPHTPDRIQQFHALCLSLARGIDYNLAQNEVPSQISELPSVLKTACSCKNEFHLLPAIMVLMISVKNACKLNWFPGQDTEELLALADEVASNFVTPKDFNSEVSTILPTVSTVMSRYYPHFKLGNVLASLEVKPGYGTHLVDFHIRKEVVNAKEELIYLFVATKDSIDTSSCIITPQEVNILLNGTFVKRRNRAFMDLGPQPPTAVNSYLKYGVNLLQVVGQFNGDYIIILGLMSCSSSSVLPVPQDYEQPAAISLDSELIEGPSLVSLNCPISRTRIKTPVKGHFCKHYQCFDFTNFVEMNFKRPSWRCPSCNQSVGFTDLRVDQKMVKALQEVGEKESEVIFSIDGSFKPASSNKHKNVSHDKALANQLGEHALESSSVLDGPGNMLDLTREDDEMDITNRCEPIDTKPVIHPTAVVSLPPLPGCNTELTHCSWALASNNQSPQPVINNSLPVGFNSMPQVQIGGMTGPLTDNDGMVPVSTDVVSCALSQQPDSSPGINFPTNSVFSSNLIHTRNFTRVSSAIQALPVQAPNTSPQQHSRPMSLPTANRPSASFQVPAGFNTQYSSSYGSIVEKQQTLSQLLYSNRSQVPNLSSVLPQNPSLSLIAQEGVRHSTPTHNSYISQTLSQPPHMRTSLPRTLNQHGVSPRTVVSNSSSSTHQGYLQRVQPPGTQLSNVRPPLTKALQTQAAIRMPASSVALGSGRSATPQAVSRMENLIDLQSEQNWRPMSRMRGALSGEEYNQALSQLSSAPPPAQTPRSRPPVPLPGAPRPSIEVLLANRNITSEVQDQGVN